MLAQIKMDIGKYNKRHKKNIRVCDEKDRDCKAIRTGTVGWCYGGYIELNAN